LDDVVAILAEYGFDTAAHRAVGYLHDTLEDTSMTRKALTGLFGPVIAHAIDFCTDASGLTRKARKTATYQRCQILIRLNKFVPTRSIPLGVVVKVADRLANLRSCLREDKTKLFSMYREEKDAFQTTYHVPGLCDRMWEEYHKLLT
jgi:(p)ppGpp synthase/HD superfamily hydrolase